MENSKEDEEFVLQQSRMDQYIQLEYRHYKTHNGKDTNRKIRTQFFIDYCVWILVPNFNKTCTAPLCAAHIASDFTCVYCAAAGTIFGSTDVYELGFSYLSISIFTVP